MGKASDARRAAQRARRPSKARLKAIRTPKKSTSTKTTNGGGGRKAAEPVLSQAEATQLRGVAAREGAEAAAKAAEQLKAEKAKGTVSVATKVKGRTVQVQFTAQEYKSLSPQQREAAVKATAQQLAKDKTFKTATQIKFEQENLRQLQARDFQRQFKYDVESVISKPGSATARDIDVIRKEYDLTAKQTKDLISYVDYEKQTRGGMSQVIKEKFSDRKVIADFQKVSKVAVAKSREAAGFIGRKAQEVVERPSPNLATGLGAPKIIARAAPYKVPIQEGYQKFIVKPYEKFVQPGVIRALETVEKLPATKIAGPKIKGIVAARRAIKGEQIDRTREAKAVTFGRPIPKERYTIGEGFRDVGAATLTSITAGLKGIEASRQIPQYLGDIKRTSLAVISERRGAGFSPLIEARPLARPTLQETFRIRQFQITEKALSQKVGPVFFPEKFETAAVTYAGAYALGAVSAPLSAFGARFLTAKTSAAAVGTYKLALAAGAQGITAGKAGIAVARTGRVITTNILPAALGTYAGVRIYKSTDPATEAAKLTRLYGTAYLGATGPIGTALSRKQQQLLFEAQTYSNIVRADPGLAVGPRFVTATGKKVTLQKYLKARFEVARALQKADLAKIETKEGLTGLKVDTFSKSQLSEIQRQAIEKGVIAGGSTGTGLQLTKTGAQYREVFPKVRDPAGAKILAKTNPTLKPELKKYGDLDLFIPEGPLGRFAVQSGLMKDPYAFTRGPGFDIKTVSQLKNFYGYKPQIIKTEKGLQVVGLGTQYVKAMQGMANLGQADAGLKYRFDVVDNTRTFYRTPKDVEQLRAITREAVALNLLPKKTAGAIQTLQEVSSARQLTTPTFARTSKFKFGDILNYPTGGIYQGKLPIAVDLGGAQVPKAPAGSPAPSTYGRTFSPRSPIVVNAFDTNIKTYKDIQQESVQSFSTNGKSAKLASKSPSLSSVVSPVPSTNVYTASLKSYLGAGKSPSASLLASSSFSPSRSLSSSASLSPSFSPSPSVSPSPSFSPSFSVSPSPSASISPSVSPSISPSISVSPSVSPSISASYSSSRTPPPIGGFIFKLNPPKVGLVPGIKRPRFKQPKRYTPTLRATLGQIRAPKGKAKKFRLTGLEERPILF